ncbi:unnamed protein product [Linum tenue]|uniref:Uncharacterized protein n=1 Tax=Linum tenue TaxID=586396 RepID=A0AAV0MW65_9ROSI|nr:unnamed protein product [Linum tenue]CAI0464525.1 unnamed protein product [Linum tenue]
MDVPSASHCSSSGCESGWTLYLDQSSFSNYNDGNPYQSYAAGYTVNNDSGIGNYGSRAKLQYEEEEEDLSMVSDASSGPPTGYYDEGEGEDCCNNRSTGSKKKNSSRSCQSLQQKQFHHQYLDDTASSPALKTKKQLNKSDSSAEELSQGFSATHFKGKSLLKKHFGFFHSSQSVSKEAGGFPGRKWK